MPDIKCFTEYCVHCNKDYACELKNITLRYAECQTFRSITATEEYKQKYYKRAKNDLTGKHEKYVGYGKRLEINGLVLFTEEDTRHGDNYIVTEEISGASIKVSKLKDEKRLAEIKERISVLIPVKDLPDSR